MNNSIETNQNVVTDANGTVENNVNGVNPVVQNPNIVYGTNNNQKAPKQKKNTGLIVVIIALVIIILGLGTYIVMEKVLKSDENQTEKDDNNSNTNNDNSNDQDTNNNENNNDQQNPLPITITSGILMKSGSDSDEKTFEYNGTTHKVRLEVEKTNEYSSTKTVYIDENKVTTSRPFYYIGTVYYLGDLLVVETDGSDIRSTVLHFYDATGKEVDTFFSVTEGNVKMGPLNTIGSSGKPCYEITGDTITARMTGGDHGPTITLKDGTQLNPNDEEMKAKYNITDDTIVAGTYEIKYLGNGKFSEPKMIESTTFKELFN